MFQAFQGNSKNQDSIRKPGLINGKNQIIDPKKVFEGMQLYQTTNPIISDNYDAVMADEREKLRKAREGN